MFVIQQVLYDKDTLKQGADSVLLLSYRTLTDKLDRLLCYPSEEGRIISTWNCRHMSSPCNPLVLHASRFASSNRLFKLDMAIISVWRRL